MKKRINKNSFNLTKFDFDKSIHRI